MTSDGNNKTQHLDEAIRRYEKTALWSGLLKVLLLALGVIAVGFVASCGVVFYSMTNAFGSREFDVDASYLQRVLGDQYSGCTFIRGRRHIFEGSGQTWYKFTVLPDDTNGFKDRFVAQWLADANRRASRGNATAHSYASSVRAPQWYDPDSYSDTEWIWLFRTITLPDRKPYEEVAGWLGVSPYGTCYLVAMRDHADASTTVLISPTTLPSPEQ